MEYFKLVQAYRYLLSAKVIDQLEEFKIQPNYERLCRSLYKYAKKPEQLKLLWKKLLEKSHGRPDCINSSHVEKIWKELCMDKKYSALYQNEEDIMNKVDMILNKHSKNLKMKQLYQRKNISLKNKVTKNKNDKNIYYSSAKIECTNPKSVQKNMSINMNSYNTKIQSFEQYNIVINDTINSLSPPICECSSSSNEESIKVNSNLFETLKDVNIIPFNNHIQYIQYYEQPLMNSYSQNIMNSPLTLQQNIFHYNLN
ncbi:hypothetical protein PIROE2DRAFT_16882 [Piromyces sp. E2]|nr:hypothetical protein PIROE2DRAFT_16882 [Piromyces sp. E2]|eukprot:OUM57976.1 hypothetical protein PIROE2DRAFT_16882 [Piromyces sp. E2]